MFVEDFEILSQEMKIAQQGGLPPLISFVITTSSMIVSFILSFFVVYSYLRNLFGLGFAFALFLTIGTFVILSALISEILTVMIQHRQSKHV